MKMRIIVGTACIAALGAATPLAAAGNAKSGPTVGDCISDGIYGNEPNIVGPFAPGGPAEQEPGTKGGRVVPSQSPGPFVNAGPNEPPRNDRVRGGSVGDFNKQFGGGAVPEFCRAATSTASAPAATRITGPSTD